MTILLTMNDKMKRAWRFLFGCRHVYDPVIGVMPLRIIRYECSRCHDVQFPINGEKEYRCIADCILQGRSW